jgi:cytochrome P450
VRIAARTRAARHADDPAAVLRALARGADRAVGLRTPFGTGLLVTHPDVVDEVLVGDAGVLTKGPGLQLTRPLLGDGLLTSEGDQHERARRLVAPAFAPRRLAAYTEGFAACTGERLVTWRDGSEVDLRAEMATLTLEIVGRTLLGVDLTRYAGGVRESLEAALRLFDEVSVGVVALAGGRRGRRSVVGPDGLGLGLGADVVRPIHEAVAHVVEERRARPSEDRGDVLTALLRSSREPGGLTDAEVHDNVVTLLLAGHETTAGALTWTLDLVGRHPEVRRRLQAEADGLGGRAPDFEGLRELRYTRAVLSEAMRLRPPAWILGRSTTGPLTVDGRWHVPARTTVLVSPLLLHTDPRWWPEPERFDPQRWLDGSGTGRPRSAYLPFGTGPRACIGEQFAWAEATTVLALVAARWEVTPSAAAPPRPQFRVTMRPGEPVPARLTARQATWLLSSRPE